MFICGVYSKINLIGVVADLRKLEKEGFDFNDFVIIVIIFHNDFDIESANEDVRFQRF